MRNFTGDLKFAQPPPEVQATPADISMFQNSQVLQYLRDIRNSLAKQIPTVLCQTIVQGAVNGVISDTAPHTIKFSLGGAPVKVYAVTYWSQSPKTIRISPVGLATAADGWTITNFLGSISQVELTEMSIAVSVAGAVGVNIPSGPQADGSVFIYGWTTPYTDEYKDND